MLNGSTQLAPTLNRTLGGAFRARSLDADFDAIVDGLHQILFGSQIPLRCLNRRMSQEQLNLLEIASRFAAQLRARSS